LRLIEFCASLNPGERKGQNKQGGRGQLSLLVVCVVYRLLLLVVVPDPSPTATLSLPTAIDLLSPSLLRRVLSFNGHSPLPLPLPSHSAYSLSYDPLDTFSLPPHKRQLFGLCSYSLQASTFVGNA
jgi:hypothetical protein